MNENCGNCDHEAEMHNADTGECEEEGCSCTEYLDPDEEDDDEDVEDVEED